MRIAHIVCRFPPYVGGMGVVAYEQVKRLTKNGHDVTVFTLASQDKLNPDKIDFKIKYIKTLRIGNGGFCPQLLFELKKFDIIELHYPFYGAQEFIWLAKNLGHLKKTKLVIWYHMDASLRNIFIKLWHWQTWFIQKSLFNCAHKICSASLDYVKNSKIKKIYAKYPKKFIEIPFGTNQHPEKVNSGQVEELKNKLNIKLEKIILFVGGLDSAHYFKGVPILIEAIKKLSNNKKIKLIVIGDGNLREDYQKQVRGLNLEDRIIFTGRIKYQELQNYYALCDLVVLPSTTRAEAFGLVLVEAKTFGKPVIGSDLPGVRDAVGESGLTAKPGDAYKLAEKIETILNSPNLYQKFSRQAIRDVREKYNWDKHLQRLLEVYKF